MARAGPEERALRGRYWKALRQRRGELANSEPDALSRRHWEEAWRAEAEQRIAERASTHQVWRELLELRTAEARDAGAPGFIDLRSTQLGRADYGRGDLRRLHYGIEEWVSPVLVRIYEEHRVTGGLKTFRPWDLVPVPTIMPAQEHARETRGPLGAAGESREFRSVIRHAEELSTAATDDPATMLLRFLLRWADSAMIDSFEDWAYKHPREAMDRGACARQWQSCWLRFLPGVDWTGLDEELGTEWHDRWPIFLAPLRAIETAIAQLLAAQVWARGRTDSKEIAAAQGAVALDEAAVREAVEALEEGLAPGR
jgi:oligoendopeptidase F